MVKINKKTIIILSILIILLSLVFIFILKKDHTKNYPEEPIEFSSLSETTLDVDISSIKDFRKEDISVYSVVSEYKEELINTIILNLGLSFSEKEITLGDPTIWNDRSNSIYYYKVTDILVFKLKDGIDIGNSENSIETFFAKYIDIEYEFDIVEEEKTNTGGERIYGRRLLDEIPIEIGYGYEYSDYLEFNKNGYLIGGQILLTEFTKEDLNIPFVSDKYLQEVINKDVYPKEAYINTSVLTSVLDINYLDDAWGEIEDSASNCIGNKQETIFIFKKSNQKYLLPIFKITGTCEVEYEDNIYSVPTTFYTLAADPEYITRD